MVTSVAFSLNSLYLATGSDDKNIIIWSLKNGAIIKRLVGHTDSVTSVVFSPNSFYLATGSSGKTAIIWELSSGSLI